MVNLRSVLFPFLGVYLSMNLLLENNQRHSRSLFLGCPIIGLLFSPLVLRLVDKSMSSLHSEPSQTQLPPTNSNASGWDLRSM
jgi:hypothetical protein